MLVGAKDGSEFEAWQQKKLGEDRRQKEAELERKRVEGKLSREEAIIARQKISKENQQKVIIMTYEFLEILGLWSHDSIRSWSDGFVILCTTVVFNSMIGS